MASNYISISQYNEDQLGKDRASRMSQVAMYADTAHFIFELLQNADDANATEIHFILSMDQLIVEHDGTPFTEDNVKAISYFGKGKTDYTKIGHFGLGFKSVFAYTATPHVHSDNESFQITRLYSLAATKYPEDLKRGRTRFVLPFDHLTMKPDYIEPGNLKSAMTAYNEIAKKLVNLGGETILFTKSLVGIHWVTEDKEGHYIREDTPVDRGGREVCIVTSDSEGSYYLVFEKSISWPDENGIQIERRPVQIAFTLDKSLQENGTIVAVEDARLFVFFRTDKETHVGFILQGPYRTTPARDNVPVDDKFNQHLVMKTMELLGMSIDNLRSLEQLNLDTISTFPIKQELFKTENLFSPLYLLIRLLMEKTPLLPSAGGGFVAGSNAKLARGGELTEVFRPNQLEQLFGIPGLQWLNPKLTSDNYPDLYRFIVGKKASTYPIHTAEWVVPPLTLNIEVRAEDISKLISAEFMSHQSDAWVIRFYKYLADSLLFRHFISKPIIRLEGDIHVVPFNESNVPNAFLPVESTNETIYDLPTVKRSLIKDKNILGFLKDHLNLTAPDMTDLVLKSVLPKYQCSGKNITVQDWQKDIPLILQALQTDSYEKKSRLQESLCDTAFLLTEKIDNDGKYYLSSPNKSYLNTNENKLFFAGCGEIFLLAHDKYSSSDLKILTDLGVAETPRIDSRSNYYSGYINLRNQHGSHKRGLNNFDPEWEFEGLQNAMNATTHARSKLLWKYILPYACCIRGIVETCSRQTFEDAKRKELISENGKLLMETAWLPDKQGIFHIPRELFLDDLPDDFEKSTTKAKELADKLGMLKSEDQQALLALAKGDEKRKRAIEFIANASDDVLDMVEKLNSKAKKPTEFETFKQGIITIHRPHGRNVGDITPPPGATANPARYQKKIDEETRNSVAEAKTRPQYIQFSLIRESSASTEARNFLYSQYNGKCQVTGHTFIKAKGDNYFQAVVLVSRLDAEHLNHPGNMLSLSADTAAKFMYGGFEWLDDLEAKIQAFKAERDGGSEIDRQVRIRLAGEDKIITWTEQHFMRLITLWNHA